MGRRCGQESSRAWNGEEGLGPGCLPPVPKDKLRGELVRGLEVKKDMGCALQNKGSRSRLWKTQGGSLLGGADQQVGRQMWDRATHPCPVRARPAGQECGKLLTV